MPDEDRVFSQQQKIEREEDRDDAGHDDDLPWCDSPADGERAVTDSGHERFEWNGLAVESVLDGRGPVEQRSRTNLVEAGVGGGRLDDVVGFGHEQFDGHVLALGEPDGLFEEPVAGVRRPLELSDVDRSFAGVVADEADDAVVVDRDPDRPVVDEVRHYVVGRAGELRQAAGVCLDGVADVHATVFPLTGQNVYPQAGFPLPRFRGVRRGDTGDR